MESDSILHFNIRILHPGCISKLCWKWTIICDLYLQGRVSEIQPCHSLQRAVLFWSFFWGGEGVIYVISCRLGTWKSLGLDIHPRDSALLQSLTTSLVDRSVTHVWHLDIMKTSSNMSWCIIHDCLTLDFLISA